MNVANRKCIRHISVQNMKTAHLKNRIAVIAIALTTVLFTSLFTIMISITKAYEQENFRQVGGYAHCGLKNLTAEQFEEFKDDPHIAEYARRVLIGIPYDAPFHKTNVEISSIDENYAKLTFVDFSEGSLPAENTRQAAADTRVLSLLGITPEIGAEFTVTFDVGGRETTETFTLCGYWEFDTAMPACNIFLPFSKGEEIFENLGIEKGADGLTGMTTMDIMLKSGTRHIEKDVREIIESHGYQCDNAGEDRYIDYGVNWGYLSAQTTRLFDTGTSLALVALLLLIIFTGYLIIYNVFRISVSNDIRYYGLLKTIGTTGRQIRRIISIQAYLLSAIGIPIGLLIGYLVGTILTPIVAGQFDGLRKGTLSANPLIFLLATLFSLITVVLSCQKPGRIAAQISPVEAVRYTESSGKKQLRKSQKGASLLRMAAANLSRTKGRTVITILSLTLSVVLFQLTVTFTNGFDLDKYLRRFPIDYMVADNGYFHHGRFLWNEDMALPTEVLEDLQATGFFSDIGVTYGCVTDIDQFVTEEVFRQSRSLYLPAELVEEAVQYSAREGDLLRDAVQLYGMEDYCLDQLTVLDGDLSKIKSDGNYIAAVYLKDDYNTPELYTHHAKVGDRVVFRYADSEEHVYVNTATGEVYENMEDIPSELLASIQGKDPDRVPLRIDSKESHEIEYEVAATVTIPSSLTYRFYGCEEYILNADNFKRDTGTDCILYLALEGREGAEQEAEQFLADYTEKINSMLEYESKQTYARDFTSFRNMFVLLGAVLSLIVGLVGILNFINAMLTGIFARHRELAVLQSIGMTGKQLTKMLIAEGLYYTLGAVGTTLVLSCVFAPLCKTALEKMFWFFTFRFTLTPVLILVPVFGILGALIPYVAYRFAAQRSIVERLREAE